MTARRGLIDIRDRYRSDVKAANALLTDALYTSDEGRCAVEFVVQHPEHWPVSIVDLSPAGELARLTVYGR